MAQVKVLRVRTASWGARFQTCCRRECAVAPTGGMRGRDDMQSAIAADPLPLPVRASTITPLVALPPPHQRSMPRVKYWNSRTCY